MDILKLIAKKIDEEVDAIQNDMILGVAKDFGDYKFHCGRVRGLLTIKDYIIEIAKGHEEDDD